MLLTGQTSIRQHNAVPADAGGANGRRKGRWRMTSSAQNYQHSSYRERMLEYLFLSELLQEGWFRNPPRMVEVIRPDVDKFGYDLLLECEGMRRYVQLKSSDIKSSAKYRAQTVNVELEAKQGGCVVQILLEEVNASAGLKYQLEYRFLGKEDPKEFLGLGDKKGKNTSTGEERSNTREINVGGFDKPAKINQLFDKLFPILNS